MLSSVVVAGTMISCSLWWPLRVWGVFSSNWSNGKRYETSYRYNITYDYNDFIYTHRDREATSCISSILDAPISPFLYSIMSISLYTSYPFSFLSLFLFPTDGECRILTENAYILPSRSFSSSFFSPSYVYVSPLFSSFLITLSSSFLYVQMANVAAAAAAAVSAAADDVSAALKGGEDDSNPVRDAIIKAAADEQVRLNTIQDIKIMYSAVL